MGGGLWVFHQSVVLGGEVGTARNSTVVVMKGQDETWPPREVLAWYPPEQKLRAVPQLGPSSSTEGLRV